MVLSRELLKRLRSDAEPLSKRLKLAENAFYGVDVPVVHKEDVILQWLCELNSVEENIWPTLKQCLQMEHFKVKTEIKEKLIHTVIDKLKNKTLNIDNDALECCNLLLSNTGIQQYFIETPKDLGIFMKCVLQHIHYFFKESLGITCPLNNGIPINTIYQAGTSVMFIYNTLVSMIESMTRICKDTTNRQTELKNAFVKDILYPLCKLIDHKCTDNTNRLGAAAYKCVQQIFFGWTKLEQYKTYNASGSPNIFSGIRAALTRCVETEDLQSNLSTLIFIFRAAIGAYKSETAILDLIFRELTEIAGPYKKEIMYSLFKHINDISFDFNNTINNLTFTQYFEEMVNFVMSNKLMAPIDCELLTAIAQFNPIVIESRIPEILKKIYCEENLMESSNLMNQLLECSMQLRKEENFVSQLLMSLKEAVLINEECNAKASVFFPHEFQQKFTQSIGKITNNQVITIIKTLTHYLKHEFMEPLNLHNSCINVSILRATTELLIALFNGVRIFEHTGVLTCHKIFVNVLDDLSKVLSELLNRALQLNYNTNLISLLLSAICKWTEIQSALMYYVPNAVTQVMTFPICDDTWEQLILSTTNIEEENIKINMNKLILHQMRDKLHDPTSIKLKNLIGGLEYTWEHILKVDTEILSLVKNKYLLKVVDLLLKEMVRNNNSFEYWLQQLMIENLQENKRFIGTLLSRILVEIGSFLSGGITAILTTHIDTKKVIKSMVHKHEKLSDTLNIMKASINSAQWICAESKASQKIVPYLKIILALPLREFNTDIKTLLFLVIYAITEECIKNIDVIDLCDNVFADLFEKGVMDILKFIDFTELIKKSGQNKWILKALELSLKNVTSYDVLKTWIDFCKKDKNRILIFLECVANIKLKLSNNQKIAFMKAERKLLKLTLNTVNREVKAPDEVRNLSLLLKVALSHEKISEDLKEIVYAALNSIFTSDNLTNDNANQLIQEGLRLALVVLRNPQKFQLTDTIMKQLWYSMLKCADKALLFHLVCASEPQAFCEILKLLHNEMIAILSDKNVYSFENICVIWNAIMKSDMSVKRNMLRSAAVENLLQTMQVSPIPQNFWPILLRLLNDIFSSKHLQISDITVDVIVYLTLQSLENDTILNCECALTMCITLVKARANLIVDRLPALLLLYRRIVSIVIKTSKSIEDKCDEHRCRCLALDLEKLTSLLMKQKKELARLSPYVLSDMLHPLSETIIPSFIKEPIENCICHHINICDPHAVAFLFRTLPASIQELFKVYLVTYKKFYKFSGKI